MECESVVILCAHGDAVAYPLANVELGYSQCECYLARTT